MGASATIFGDSELAEVRFITPTSEMAAMFTLEGTATLDRQLRVVTLKAAGPEMALEGALGSCLPMYTPDCRLHMS